MNTMNGYAKNILSDSYVLTAAGGHLPLSDFFTARKISEYTVNIDDSNNWYYLGTFSSHQGYSPLHIYVSGINASMNNTCTVMMSNLNGWSWSKIILCGETTNTTSLTTLGFYKNGNTGIKVYAYIKNTKSDSYAYTGYKIKITYNPSTFNAAIAKASSSDINSTVLLEYGNNAIYGNLIGDAKSQNIKLCAYNTSSEYGKLLINKQGTACTTSGTAGTTGETYLILGNSTAVSSTLNQGEHNSKGILRIYGSSTGYTNIQCGTHNTSAYQLYLPGASGQLVYHANDTAIGSTILPTYITSAGEAKAVTSIGETYLSWGGKAIDGDISLIDASVESSLANNRLSFLDPRCVKVEYSTDSGITWLDYETTNENKIKLVTSGLSSSFDIGNKSEAQTNQDMLRITISSSFTENGVTTNSVYFYMRKLLIYLTTGGAVDCRCTIETSKNSDPTTFTKLTGGHLQDDDGKYTIYKVKGQSGWNSIPIIGNFGSYTQSGNYHSVRLTFSFLSNSDSYIATTRFRIHKVYLLGTTVWTNNTGVPLMETGHMYAWDYNKNILPKITNNQFLGTSNKKWKGVYATNFYGIATHVSCTATSNNVTRPIVLTNTSNQLYYTTKATINYYTGNITAPTFTGNLIGDADTLDGVHADGLLTALTSTSTNKLSLTVGGTTKTLTTLYASYLTSIGTVNPQTGRTQNYGHVYSYNTAGTAHEGAPTTYTSVIGFGRGTGGTVEIAGGWTSGMGLWYRALRDTTDDWYDWVKVLDSSNSSVSGGGSTWGSSITVKINGTSKTLTIPSNPNTTYTFASGTNGFTVTPSGGTAQTVTVTPSITNNVTGSGTSGYLAKFNGTNTITSGPQLGSSTTTFLRNDGTWATPVDTKVTIAAITATTAANYYFPMHTGTSGTTTLVATPQIHLESLKGTTTTQGYTVLWLGSTAATGSVDNAYGILRLCAKNTYYTSVESGNNTTHVSLTLPTTSGTLALTSQLNKVTSSPVTTGTIYLTGTTNSAGEIAGQSFYTNFYVNANGVFWTSDRKFKKNIQSPVKSGLLEDETGFIRKFDWKETGKPSYGYIAQELLQQIPEAVDYDDKLNKYSVNYNVAHSAAIAQLVIKVKELESEIIRLKQLIN